jgi:uncharacterized protein YlxW (UPF0749 family)
MFPSGSFDLEYLVNSRLKAVGSSFAILVLGLALGLLLGVVWIPNAQPERDTSVLEGSQLWYTISRLEAEQQELKGTLADLRQQLAERQQTASAHTGRLQALSDELERQRLLAGLVAIRGPGVVVTLDDSEVQVPSSASANDYIIHEYDLRDIVNVLWMAGSEAVAINDERLTNQSSVYCAGSTVMVNNTRLSPPYRIRAVGNSRVQQDYLANPSYLASLKEKQRLHGLRFDVEAVADQTLPPFSGGFLVQFARLGE